MKTITNSQEETIKLGERLGRQLKAGDILGLIGELGSGKTTMVKGIAAGLGVKEKDTVSSPSFVLIKAVTSTPTSIPSLSTDREVITDETLFPSQSSWT